MSGATAVVSAFACARSPAPAGHAEHVSLAILDTVGCALAATHSDPNLLLERWCARERTTGRSTVWTTGEQVSAAQAALLNATAGHALDWDDVSPGSALHPSVVLLPALLAAAEPLGASGPALVGAYDVGAAVFRGVAEALPRPEHYRRGWHTTSTVGRLAAVAALANLRGLDERRTRGALGLVASLAGGSRANFGTMTKALHAGVAARDAVMAVDLAADGFTADPGQLEAAGGFFALFGDPGEQSLASLAAELERWRMEWPQDWALKYYPACYATHRAVDAVLGLRPEVAERVPGTIDVVVEPGGLSPLIADGPTTPEEARFSMAYAVSAALVHGELRLRQFTEEALRDESVRSLMGLVTTREEQTPPFGDPDYGDGYTIVSIGLPGGDVRRRRVEHTYGDSRTPLSRADLDTKFADCCDAAGLPPAAGRQLAAILRELPLAPNVDLLRETFSEAVCP